MVLKSWQSDPLPVDGGFAIDQNVNNHTFDFVFIYSLFQTISIIMNYKLNNLGENITCFINGILVTFPRRKKNPMPLPEAQSKI